MLAIAYLAVAAADCSVLDYAELKGVGSFKLENCFGEWGTDPLLTAFTFSIWARSSTLTDNSNQALFYTKSLINNGNYLWFGRDNKGQCKLQGIVDWTANKIYLSTTWIMIHVVYQPAVPGGGLLGLGPSPASVTVYNPASDNGISTNNPKYTLTGPYELWIGQDEINGNPLFNGWVDDLRVVRGAIPLAQVRQERTDYFVETYIYPLLAFVRFCVVGGRIRDFSGNDLQVTPMNNFTIKNVSLLARPVTPQSNDPCSPYANKLLPCGAHGACAASTVPGITTPVCTCMYGYNGSNCATPGCASGFASDGAANFQNTNPQVYVPLTKTEMPSGSSFTVTAWAILESPGTIPPSQASTNIIVAPVVAQTIPVTWGGWWFGFQKIAGTASLQFSVGTSNGMQVPCGCTFPGSGWMHIAVVWTPTTTSLYLKGSLVNSVPTTSSPLSPTTLIAQNQTQADQVFAFNPKGRANLGLLVGSLFATSLTDIAYFDGLIDEVRVFSSALTAGDIQSAAGSNTYPWTNVLLYLPFAPAIPLQDFSSSRRAVIANNFIGLPTPDDLCLPTTLCFPNPCSSGGVPRGSCSGATGTAVCSCFPGYAGPTCQQTYDVTTSCDPLYAADGRADFLGGYDSYIAVPSCSLAPFCASPAKPSNSFSLSVWAWVDVTQPSRLISQDDEALGGLFFGFAPLPYPGATATNVEFGWRSPVDLTPYVISFPLDLDPGWLLFTATFDQQVGMMRLYMNGVQQSQSTTPISSSNFYRGSPAPLMIGRTLNNSVVTGFVGAMDEITVFGAALAYSDVQGLLTRQLPSWLGDGTGFGSLYLPMRYSDGAFLDYSASPRPITQGTLVQLTQNRYPLCLVRNPCNPNPCVKGTCRQVNSNYTCVCFPGYSGTTCSVSVLNTCRSGSWTDGSALFSSSSTPASFIRVSACAFNFSTSFSLSMWARPDDLLRSRFFSPLFSKGDISLGGIYVGYVESGSAIVATWGALDAGGVGGGPNYQTRAPIECASPATWRNWVVVFDSSRGLAQLYMDGNLVSQNTANVFPPTQHLRDIMVGQATIYGSQYSFGGAIDEVVVVSRALLSTEVMTYRTTLLWTSAILALQVLNLPMRLQLSQLFDQSPTQTPIAQSQGVKFGVDSYPLCLPNSVCGPSPCSVGSCTPGTGSSYTCNCFQNFTGVKCQTSFSPLTSCNTGTPAGPSAYFDGDHSFLMVQPCNSGTPSSSASCLTNGDLSFSVWVNTPKMDQAPIFSTGPAGLFFGFMAGDLVFGWGTSWLRVSCNHANQWTWYVASYARGVGMFGELRLYVNGVLADRLLASSAPPQLVPATTWNTTILIGRGQLAPSENTLPTLAPPNWNAALTVPKALPTLTPTTVNPTTTRPTTVRPTMSPSLVTASPTRGPTSAPTAFGATPVTLAPTAPTLPPGPAPPAHQTDDTGVWSPFMGTVCPEGGTGVNLVCPPGSYVISLLVWLNSGYVSDFYATCSQGTYLYTGIQSTIVTSSATPLYSTSGFDLTMLHPRSGSVLYQLAGVGSTPSQFQELTASTIPDRYVLTGVQFVTGTCGFGQLALQAVQFKFAPKPVELSGWRQQAEISGYQDLAQPSANTSDTVFLGKQLSLANCEQACTNGGTFLACNWDGAPRGYYNVCTASVRRVKMFNEPGAHSVQSLTYQPSTGGWSSWCGSATRGSVASRLLLCPTDAIVTAITITTVPDGDSSAVFDVRGQCSDGTLLSASDAVDISSVPGASSVTLHNRGFTPSMMGPLYGDTWSVKSIMGRGGAMGTNLSATAFSGLTLDSDLVGFELALGDAYWHRVGLEGIRFMFAQGVWTQWTGQVSQTFDSMRVCSAGKWFQQVTTAGIDGRLFSLGSRCGDGVILNNAGGDLTATVDVSSVSPMVGQNGFTGPDLELQLSTNGEVVGLFSRELSQTLPPALGWITKSGQNCPSPSGVGVGQCPPNNTAACTAACATNSSCYGFDSFGFFKDATCASNLAATNGAKVILKRSIASQVGMGVPGDYLLAGFQVGVGTSQKNGQSGIQIVRFYFTKPPAVPLPNVAMGMFQGNMREFIWHSRLLTSAEINNLKPVTGTTNLDVQFHLPILPNTECSWVVIAESEPIENELPSSCQMVNSLKQCLSSCEISGFGDASQDTYTRAWDPLVGNCVAAWYEEDSGRCCLHAAAEDVDQVTFDAPMARGILPSRSITESSSTALYGCLNGPFSDTSIKQRPVVSYGVSSVTSRPFCAASSPCTPSPCIGGSCVEAGGTYQCKCFPGYYGPLCTGWYDTSSQCQPTTTSNGHAAFSSVGGASGTGFSESGPAFGDGRAVIVIDTCDFNITTSFAITLWARPSDVSGLARMVSYMDESNPFSMVLGWNSNGVLEFGFGAGNRVQASEDLSCALANSWHHYAAYWDSTSNLLTLVVDNQFRYNLSVTAPSGAPTNASLSLALLGSALMGGSRVPFSGFLDEVRFFYTLPTQPSYTSLFLNNTLAAIDYSKILVYFPFKSNTTVTDYAFYRSSFSRKEPTPPQPIFRIEGQLGVVLTKVDPLCFPMAPCNPDPCVRGMCQPVNATAFTCLCLPGYQGALCDDVIQPAGCFPGTTDWTYGNFEAGGVQSPTTVTDVIFQTDFTLLAWLSLTDDTTVSRAISWNDEVYAGGYFGFNNGIFTAGWRTTKVQHNAACVEGEWHHYALVYSVASKSLNLYVDTVLVDNTTDSSSGPYFWGVPVTIGGYFSSSQFYPAHTNWDRIRIYKRALTPTDLTNQFEAAVDFNMIVMDLIPQVGNATAPATVMDMSETGIVLQQVSGWPWPGVFVRPYPLCLSVQVVPGTVQPVAYSVYRPDMGTTIVITNWTSGDPPRIIGFQVKVFAPRNPGIAPPPFHMEVTGALYGNPMFGIQTQCIDFGSIIVSDIRNVFPLQCILNPDRAFGGQLQFILEYQLGSNYTTQGFVDYPPDAIGNSTFSFPRPTISPNTLVRPPSAITTTKLIAILQLGEVVSFRGTNFVADPSIMTVTFGPVENPELFSCELQLTGSPATDQNTVVCRVVTQAFGIDLVFQVNVLGSKVVGNDTYSFPSVPLVYAVSGCQPDSSIPPNPNITTNCPTPGGVLITVYGDNFIDPSTVIINENPCINSTRVSPQLITCILPVGAGTQSVTVAATGSQLLSTPNLLVYYAGPTIKSIYSPPCKNDTAKPLHIADCPRSGSSLTIDGSNFGVSGAKVLVGIRTCTNVQHVAADHSRVICTLPPGHELNQPVILIVNQGTLTRQAVDVDFLQCPAGQFDEMDTSPPYNCGICSQGTYSDVGTTGACLECAPGRYRSGQGFSVCLDCNAGAYQAAPGQSFCYSCTPGSWSTAGQSSCPQCTIGTFTSSNTTGCVQCGLGTFQARTGQTYCDDCDRGMTTTQPGQDSCIQCPSDTVAPPGARVCSECPSGVSVKVGLDCVCAAGYYATSLTPDADIQCNPCVQGAACTVIGLTYKFVPAEAGWWQIPSAPGNYQPCLYSSHCVQQESATDSGCASYRTGALCSVCQPGYSTKGGKAPCTPCPAQGTSYGLSILFILLITAGLGVIFYIVLRSDASHDAAITNQDGSSKKKNLGRTTSNLGRTTSRMELSRQGSRSMMGTETSVVGREPSMVRTLDASMRRNQDGSLKNANDHEDSKTGFANAMNDPSENPSLLEMNRPEAATMQMSPEMTRESRFTFTFKLVVSFFQICTSLSAFSGVQLPSYYVAFISNFDFMNLDFIPWTSLSCVARFSYFDRMVAEGLMPIGLLLAAAILFFGYILIASKLDYSDSNAGRQLRQRRVLEFWKIFLFTLFLLYPAVSKWMLDFFICRGIQGVYYLLQDFTVICFSPQWDKYVPFAVAMVLVYPVGIPFFFLILIWRKRFKLTHPSTVVAYGFLYKAYNQNSWWFELVEMLHKLTLTSLINFFKPAQKYQLGMAASSLYTMAVILISPYVHARNEALALLCECEIFLILLAAHTVQVKGAIQPGSQMDVLLSTILIGATIISFIVFLVVVVIHARQNYWMLQRLAATRRVKKRLAEQAKSRMQADQNAALVKSVASNEEGALLIQHTLAEQNASAFQHLKRAVVDVWTASVRYLQRNQARKPARWALTVCNCMCGAGRVEPELGIDDWEKDHEENLRMIQESIYHKQELMASLAIKVASAQGERKHRIIEEMEYTESEVEWLTARKLQQETPAFTVTLDHMGVSALGVSFAPFLDESGIVVREIGPGVVARWNQRNDHSEELASNPDALSHVIRPGDIVLGVARAPHTDRPKYVELHRHEPFLKNAERLQNKVHKWSPGEVLYLKLQHQVAPETYEPLAKEKQKSLARLAPKAANAKGVRKIRLREALVSNQQGLERLLRQPGNSDA